MSRQVSGTSSSVGDNGCGNSSFTMDGTPTPFSNVPHRPRVASQTLSRVPEGQAQMASTTDSTNVLETPSGQPGQLSFSEDNTPLEREMKKQRKYIREALRDGNVAPKMQQMCYDYLQDLKRVLDQKRFGLLTPKFKPIVQHVEYRRRAVSDTQRQHEARISFLLHSYIHAEFGDYFSLDSSIIRNSIKWRMKGQPEWKDLDMEDWINKLNDESPEMMRCDMREFNEFAKKDRLRTRDAKKHHSQIKASCKELGWDYEFTLFVLREYDERNKAVHNNMKRLIVKNEAAEVGALLTKALETIRTMFTSKQQYKAEQYSKIVQKHRDQWLDTDFTGRWAWRKPVYLARMDKRFDSKHPLKFSDLQRLASLPPAADDAAIEKLIASIRSEKRKSKTPRDGENVAHEAARQKREELTVARLNRSLKKSLVAINRLSARVEELEAHEAAWETEED